MLYRTSGLIAQEEEEEEEEEEAEEEEPQTSSRTHISKSGILIVAYSSPTPSLPATPKGPVPFVRDVCAEWVRHALYVSSK